MLKWMHELLRLFLFVVLVGLNLLWLAAFHDG